MTSVALGSSSEIIRTSDNLRELFNRTKNRLLKIPAEFRRNSGFLIFQLTGVAIPFFTITTEIHARSLANFYCQYADIHINLKFMRRACDTSPSESGQFNNLLS